MSKAYHGYISEHLCTDTDTDMALEHRCLSNSGTRSLQDLDVLAVSDFKNPCSRPDTHPRRLLTIYEGQERAETRVSKIQDGEGFDILRYVG